MRPKEPKVEAALSEAVLSDAVELVCKKFLAFLQNACAFSHLYPPLHVMAGLITAVSAEDRFTRRMAGFIHLLVYEFPGKPTFSVTG